MSGPYISHEEQVRIQKELERQSVLRTEQLALVQEGYLVCGELKKLLLGFDGIVADGESPVKASAAQISKSIQSCLQDWENCLSGLKGNSSDTLSYENEKIRSKIRTMQENVEKYPSFLQTQKLELREHHVRCLRELFRKIEAEMPAACMRKEDAQKRARELEAKKRELFFQDAVRQMESQLSEMRKRAGMTGFTDPEFERIACEMERLKTDERSPEKLHHLDIHHIQPLEDRLRRHEKEVQDLDRELSRHLAVYDELCDETGLRPVESFPFCRESIREIDAACSTLLIEREWMLKRNYTLEKIHQYMREKNLTYIGEKTEGVHIVRRAYRIRDNIILHILYNSQGRMTIEIAMADHENRPPERREAEQIVDAQMSSCKMLKELFDRLNEAGMKFRTDFAGNGGAQFAQIIDTTGFTGGAAIPEQTAQYSRYRDHKMKYRKMGV